MSQKTPYQVNLPENLEEKLERAAKEAGTTKEEVIKQAVSRLLDSRTKARATDEN